MRVTTITAAAIRPDAGLRFLFFRNSGSIFERTMLRVLPVCFLTLLVAFTAAPAGGQNLYSRFELGAQYSTIREADSNLEEKNFSGFGARFAWNLNRRVAVESQVDFFPEEGVPLPYVQGGQTLQAVFGIRAKVVETRQLAVFGLVRPGLLHFTNVQFPSGVTTPPFLYHPATYFVLNLGGGIEFYPSRRWILRFDIEGDPYRVPATFNARAPIAAPVGKINDTTRLSFGAAYRLGRLTDNESEKNISGDREFGPLFSALMIAREGSAANPLTESGFGGYASYRFYGALYLDGDVLYFPRSAPAGPHDGGTILQTTVGLKGGIRRNHFGFFGKARPGFHSYSQALSTVGSSNVTAVYGYSRSTNFVLDLGGIVEFYPQPSGTLRIEAGDTHLYFDNRTVNVDGSPVTFPGGKLKHSIQFIFGYGWRF
jgi:hypothetical protein